LSAREDILAALRTARPPGEHPLPALPRFPGLEGDLLAAFKASLAVMGGQWVAPARGEPLGAFIRARVGDGPLIRSATDELPDFPRVDAVNRPRDLENVDVAVAKEDGAGSA
jgi:L-lactate dehydrogenase complex protein LldG